MSDSNIKISSGTLIDIWILSALVWICGNWLGVAVPQWIVDLCFWLFWMMIIPVIILFIVMIVVWFIADVI